MEDWVEPEEEDEEDDDEKQCWFCGRVTTEIEEIGHDVGFEPIVKGLPAIRKIEIPSGPEKHWVFVCQFCSRLIGLLAGGRDSDKE